MTNTIKMHNKHYLNNITNPERPSTIYNPFRPYKKNKSFDDVILGKAIHVPVPRTKPIGIKPQIVQQTSIIQAAPVVSNRHKTILVDAIPAKSSANNALKKTNAKMTSKIAKLKHENSKLIRRIKQLERDNIVLLDENTKLKRRQRS